jgi:hypothetical protein
MALASGLTFGAYEIAAPIGPGGTSYVPLLAREPEACLIEEKPLQRNVVSLLNVRRRTPKDQRSRSNGPPDYPNRSLTINHEPKFN